MSKRGVLKDKKQETMPEYVQERGSQGQKTRDDA